MHKSILLFVLLFAIYAQFVQGQAADNIGLDLNEFEAKERIIALHINYYVYLKSLGGDKECTNERDYFSSLLSFETSYLKMQEQLCQLQLSTSHNYFKSRVVQCRATTPYLDLLNYLLKEDISPWDCILPAEKDVANVIQSVKSSPSFDCVSAKNNAEQYICQNRDLANYDSYLNMLYSFITELPIENREQIIKSHVNYIGGIDKGCEDFSKATSANYGGCLRKRYLNQIKYFESLIP